MDDFFKAIRFVTYVWWICFGWWLSGVIGFTLILLMLFFILSEIVL